MKFAGHGQNYYNNISKKVREKTSKEKIEVYMKNYILREDQNQLLEKVKWVITNLILQKVEKELYKIISKKKFNNAIYR